MVTGIAMDGTGIRGGQDVTGVAVAATVVERRRRRRSAGGERGSASAALRETGVMVMVLSVSVDVEVGRVCYIAKWFVLYSKVCFFYLFPRM